MSAVDITYEDGVEVRRVCAGDTDTAVSDAMTDRLHAIIHTLRTRDERKYEDLTPAVERWTEIVNAGQEEACLDEYPGLDVIGRHGELALFLDGQTAISYEQRAVNYLRAELDTLIDRARFHFETEQDGDGGSIRVEVDNEVELEGGTV